MNVSGCGGLFSRPALPKTIVRSFFVDAHWLIFCFSWFPVCYLLYDISITILHNTTVNAQPLSPPMFEKIAPHFKNKVFSYFVYLRLRFLYFFICSLMFGCPFPPLAQIGPICGRFWFHFCSVLVKVGERWKKNTPTNNPQFAGPSARWRVWSRTGCGLLIPRRESRDPEKNESPPRFDIWEFGEILFGPLACVITYWLWVINP